MPKAVLSSNTGSPSGRHCTQRCRNALLGNVLKRASRLNAQRSGPSAILRSTPPRRYGNPRREPALRTEAPSAAIRDRIVRRLASRVAGDIGIRQRSGWCRHRQCIDARRPRPRAAPLAASLAQSKKGPHRLNAHLCSGQNGRIFAVRGLDRQVPQSARGGACQRA